MVATAKRLTPNEVDVIEQLALEMFEEAYLGQYNRISKAIQRAKPTTLARFEAAAIWDDEPELVTEAVQKWYDDNFVATGRDVFDSIDLDAEWADVNTALLDTSKARAGWFGNAMTETSLEQTQGVITKWLDTEGSTIGELASDMQSIWTGPRPQTAALTETTNLVSQSEVTVGIAAGYWGYEVVTRNDSSVRPTHEATATGGPYPMSDTAHMPPINDDYNCRCRLVLVRKDPNADD